MKSRMRAILVGLLVVVIADQVVQHAFLGTGYLMGRRVAPFDPPLFAPHQVERVAGYRALLASGLDPRRESGFDPELGWCALPSVADPRYATDERGARIGLGPVPRERTAGVQRVMAIGCSFTYGQEVDGPETWPACVDAAREDLEVVNFGYGFYGIDQAFLRYRREAEALKPDEVWLGVLPSALPRILGVYPPAQRHWTNVLHVKPRFVLDTIGGLELVPSPARSLDDLVTLLSDQDRFLESVGRHDAWVQHRPSAYERFGTSVWHRSAFARLLVTALEDGGREAKPEVLDPDSEVRRLALALVRELADEVRANGARFRVFILPDRLDLADRVEHGAAYWDGFVTDLTRAGIEGLDLAEGFASVSAQSDDRYWAPDGHYSAEGNRIAAETVVEHLTRSR